MKWEISFSLRTLTIKMLENGKIAKELKLKNHIYFEKVYATTKEKVSTRNEHELQAPCRFGFVRGLPH